MNITELKQFITLAEVYIWINLCLMLLTIISFILYAWFLYRKHRPSKSEEKNYILSRLSSLDEHATMLWERHKRYERMVIDLSKRIINTEGQINTLNENLNNLPTRRTSNKTTGKRNV